MSSNEVATNVSADKSNKVKSRRSLIMVLVAFVLPIVLAKLALEQNWLEYGVTNKGQLVEGELTLKKLGLNKSDFDQQWLILYVMPTNCDAHCEQTLESVHNSYVALGKEMPRVTPVALSQGFTEQQLSRVSKSQWQVITMPSLTKNIIPTAQILVADPQGNIFLSHQIPEKSDQLGAFGKQILADMKKVLKYSRIG